MSKWLVYHADGQQEVIDGMDVCRNCDDCGGVEKTYCDWYQEGLEMVLRIQDGSEAKEDREAAAQIEKVVGFMPAGEDRFAREYANLKSKR